MSGGRRPRIEVVRVSSTERAKLRPLLEGGVQLQARFKHHRSNNYASCGSLDDAHCRHLRYESQGSEGRQPPLATKSCDDIFAGQLSGGPHQDSPFTWQDATRSAEHLCPDATHARCATLPAGEATRSEGHIHQITRMQATTTAPLTTRLRLITFLKKLSPRPRRLTSKVLRTQNVFPWVVMELAGRRSEQQAVGLAGRCHSEDSTASDRSFAVAVRINRQRKQQALSSALQAKEPSQQAPTAPRIVIASPGPSPAPRPGPQECSVMSGGDAGKVGCPLRPDSLRLPPGRSTPSLSPDALRHGMASLESIGSCSLDVEVTASEASECNEDSASERTLRSVSLSTRTPDADCPSKLAQGGASTPEYVKRTARLFEKTTSPASCPAVVNGKSENADGNYEKLTNGTALEAKKPSYLGLACSISGYSGITTYDSKLREGFRSRDQSPGRLGLIASREVSPLRQGSDSSEGFTVHSVCGNYLVPPTKSITRFAVGTPSSVSDGFIEPQKPLLLNDKLKQNKSDDNFVNGVETFDSNNSLDSSIKVKDMGDKSTVITTDGYVKNGSPEITHGKFIDDGRRLSKDSIPRESLSDTVASIRESSKHFMSSMLSSSSFSAISSESCFDRTRAEEPTRSPITQRSHEESAKYSPDTSKTDWKNSLGAPLASPLKRSPGAVRVVEFTSQTKSYVTAVSANGATIQASASMPNQCVRDDAGSLSNSVNICKSFIQQRVERLYGPGALAQGFFIRTKGQLRDPDDQVSEDALDAEVPVRVTSSSPALPVLRHLRPEFRAQLSVAVPASRRPQDQPSPEGKVTVIPVEVEKPVLQQQVSVESVPDLQPAAPEVVLPVDPPQTDPDDAATTTNAKDGHYFLQLLKRELARLDGEARVVEADLEAGAHLSEVTLGKLRAAAGQARLLMTQKLQQFEGLCHKNLAQSSDEPFPTTSEDLAGFWDMVMLQVDQVDGLFAEISDLRAKNWVEAKPHWEAAPEPTVTTPSKRQSVAKKAAPKAVRQETSKQVETARKAHEDARRKMMEQRRKMMREKAAATTQADIEIFVPLENGKHV